jgi:hypothetical protein
MAMKLQIIAYALGLAGLSGCNTMSPTTPATHTAPGPVTPRSTVSDAEHLYALSRQAHTEGRLTKAAQGYETLLTLNPEHVEALNALGVIRSQESRPTEALALFARALALAPTAAHIHNNMGYTLLREERLDEARVALQLALALRPDSPQTQRNLALLAQARAARDGRAASAEPAVLPGAPAATLVAVAPRVFELRSTPPRQAPAPMSPFAESGDSGPEATAAPTAHKPPDLPNPEVSLHNRRIEVSNGVGTNRLARRTAARLAESGMPPARLTNARPYRQQHTQIEYIPGQQAAVQALAARLPVPVEQVPVGQLNAAVHMRLVLGHDPAGRAIAVWADGTRAQQLAAQARGY